MKNGLVQVQYGRSSLNVLRQDLRKPTKEPIRRKHDEHPSGEDDNDNADIAPVAQRSPRIAIAKSKKASRLSTSKHKGEATGGMPSEAQPVGQPPSSLVEVTLKYVPKRLVRPYSSSGSETANTPEAATQQADLFSFSATTAARDFNRPSMEIKKTTLPQVTYSSNTSNGELVQAEPAVMTFSFYCAFQATSSRLTMIAMTSTASWSTKLRIR